MRLSTLRLLAFISGVSAKGKWYAANCDGDVAQNSMKNGVTIAEVASNVLNTPEKANSQNVKDVLGLVFREATSYQAKVNVLKGHLAGVAQFSKTESPKEQVTTNQDLIIFCDEYALPDKTGRPLDTYMNKYLTDKEITTMKKCHDPANLPTDEDPSMIKGMVITSDEIIEDDKKTEIQRWVDAGQPAEGLDPKKFSVENADVPDHFNFCKNFALLFGSADMPLNLLDSNGEISEYWAALDFTQPETLNNLAIGADVNTLHELTHSHLGGRSYDLPEGNCYEWECVKSGQNPQNGDTIANLGFALFMLEKGWKMNDEGGFQKV